MPHRIALALIDTDQHRLAHQAVRQCLGAMDFAQVLIFTDQPQAFCGLPTLPCATIRCIGDYNRLVTQTLAEHLQADHVLVVQYDGFVLHGNCFEPEFLRHDYIGAPWPGPGPAQVGNGGFSLRSKRLVDAVARLPYDPAAEAEDLFICRTARPLLEAHAKCSFAPVPLAQRFSVEYPAVAHRTFGFHGIFHLPAVYRNDIRFLIDNLSPRLLLARAGYLLPGLQAIGPQAVQMLQARLRLLQAEAQPAVQPAVQTA